LPDYHRVIPVRSLPRHPRAAGCFRLAFAACAEQNFMCPFCAAKGIPITNIQYPTGNARQEIPSEGNLAEKAKLRIHNI
ncbi:MAG: hypothetical protein NTX50_14345, partial [Candidatus Sumerlaeota bacterium]|nr:hypothetical protein [Candidatus Sumerlaeota bacterium]